jgi:hypothetical protein
MGALVSLLNSEVGPFLATKSHGLFKVCMLVAPHGGSICPQGSDSTEHVFSAGWLGSFNLLGQPWPIAFW